MNSKNNNTLKVLAVVMSVVTWLAVRTFTGGVTSSSLAHRVFTVPISYTGMPEGFVYVARDTQVTVTVRGKLANLDHITPSLITAIVDLSSRTKNSNALELVNVTVPGGADVYNVEPAYVWVQVSKSKSMSVPIRVNVQGQVASGYSVGQIGVMPKQITVSGGAEIVDDVVAVRAPLVLTDKTRTFTTSINNLIPIDGEGHTVQNVTLGDEEINATVPILALKSVDVNLKRISVRAPAGVRYSVSVEPESVLFECEPQTKVPDVVVTQPRQIVLGDAEQRVVTVPLQLPEGLQLAKGLSGNAVITVSRTGKSSKKSSADG